MKDNVSVFLIQDFSHFGVTIVQMSWTLPEMDLNGIK